MVLLTIGGHDALEISVTAINFVAASWLHSIVSCPIMYYLSWIRIWGSNSKQEILVWPIYVIGLAHVSYDTG